VEKTQPGLFFLRPAPARDLRRKRERSAHNDLVQDTRTPGKKIVTFPARHSRAVFSGNAGHQPRQLTSGASAPSPWRLMFPHNPFIIISFFPRCIFLKDAKHLDRLM
jgi:hypothetical protein